MPFWRDAVQIKVDSGVGQEQVWVQSGSSHIREDVVALQKRLNIVVARGFRLRRQRAGVRSKQGAV